MWRKQSARLAKEDDEKRAQEANYTAQLQWWVEKYKGQMPPDVIEGEFWAFIADINKP